MPTPPKTSAAMTKNMTEAERIARAEAEAGVLPDRGRLAELTPPALMRANAAARKYWDLILSRMEGFTILDDLDSDTLGIYCVMLSRYDGLCKDLRTIRTRLNKAEDPSAAESALNKLDAINGKMQRLEGNILQYAEKLGLTPSGRVRLAQKRAEQAAAQVDPDGDLFGD